MSSSKSKVFAALAAGLLLAAGATTVAALSSPQDDPPKEPAPRPAAKAPVPADDPAAKELKVLAGTWKVVKIATGEKESTPADVRKMRWVITGDELAAYDNNDAPDRVEEIKIKVNPGKSPKEIDLTAVTGPEQVRGKTMPGIYELKDDMLTVAIRDLKAVDKGRPTAFQAGEDVGVIVLARECSPGELLAALEGAWKVAKLEGNGKEVPEAERKLIRWVSYRDVVWLINTANNTSDEKMTVRLPAGGKNWIDFVAHTGPPELKGKVLPGIYELKDNTFTVCIRNKPDDPNGRPTELKGGEGVTLMVLEKVVVR